MYLYKFLDKDGIAEMRSSEIPLIIGSEQVGDLSNMVEVVSQLPLLSDIKNNQIAAVHASCMDDILSGFSSVALGLPHTYPSRQGLMSDGKNYYDQTNLIGAVASGLPIITFWCADSSGTWVLVDHTAEQIKQVLADAGIKRMECSAKLGGLVHRINAAANADDVYKEKW